LEARRCPVIARVRLAQADVVGAGGLGVSLPTSALGLAPHLRRHSPALHAAAERSAAVHGDGRFARLRRRCRPRRALAVQGGTLASARAPGRSWHGVATQSSVLQRRAACCNAWRVATRRESQRSAACCNAQWQRGAYFAAGHCAAAAHRIRPVGHRVVWSTSTVGCRPLEPRRLARGTAS
jgi:hypothetical protein